MSGSERGGGDPLSAPAGATAALAGPSPGRGLIPDTPWHRLHPLSPLVQVGRRLLPLALVLALPVLTSGRGGHTQEWSDVAILGVAAVLGVVAWLVTRWRVESGILRVETGLVRRRVTQLPVARIQSVDVVRPGTARLFGLAEVRVRSGGSHEGDARLAYLASERAEAVRDQLLALARGGALADPGLEAPLARVRTRRLLVALPLRGSILLPAVVLVAAAWVGVELHPGSGFTALVLVGALGLLTELGRQYSSQFGFEVSETGDGLLLRGGAIGTVTETVARRRIQALRMSEPWLWRPFGWATLVADVAGGQRRKDEDRAASGRLRVLVPVARRETVLRVAEELLGPSLADPGTAPPAPARLKAPLSYHFLRSGLTPACAVGAVGRMRRLTTAVPLAKVQSIRWEQGPVQRWLGLATVHLDVVGPRQAGVALHDRSVGEARQLLRDLPQLCRAARRRDGAAAEIAPTGEAGGPT